MARCGVVPARRRAAARWAGYRWTYWRLHDAHDHVIGFKRTCGAIAHYVDLREDHWQREPIPYAEEYLLAEPLLSFHYLEDPE